MISSPTWIKLCAFSLALAAAPTLAQAPAGAVYMGELTLIEGVPQCPGTGAILYRARIVGTRAHFDYMPVNPPGPEQRDAAVLDVNPDGSFGRVRQEEGMTITSSGRFSGDTATWEVRAERDNALVCHHRVNARRVADDQTAPKPPTSAK